MGAAWRDAGVTQLGVETEAHAHAHVAKLKKHYLGLAISFLYDSTVIKSQYPIKAIQSSEYIRLY